MGDKGTEVRTGLAEALGLGDPGASWHNSRDGVAAFDLFSGLFKSIFFGGIIALVSCYQGFNCEAGAEGVGCP